MSDVTQPETIQPQQPAAPVAPAGPQPKVITTPVGGILVELKPFINGFDKEAIEAVFYEAASVSASMANTEDSKINFDLPAIAKGNRKTIERVVLSVGGSKENVVDAVLNMHVKDYEAVVAAVNEVTEGVTTEKKSD